MRTWMAAYPPAPFTTASFMATARRSVRPRRRTSALSMRRRTIGHSWASALRPAGRAPAPSVARRAARCVPGSRRGAGGFSCVLALVDPDPVERALGDAGRVEADLLEQLVALPVADEGLGQRDPQQRRGRKAAL